MAGLIFFETFSYLWTSEVISNVVLATLAGGPYGCMSRSSFYCFFSDDSVGWYYYGPREQGEMPAHPTMSSFSRASTLSLGSIAFGSLIVAILELIKMILNAARNTADADGHRMLPVPPSIKNQLFYAAVEACLACCAACFIGCIESLIEYFNRLVFIRPIKNVRINVR